ncbi:LOW QUALITY PROTEIN: opsin-3-like [Theristicus caerulescens]
MPVPAAAPSCGAAAGARDPGPEPGPCLSPSGRLAAAVCLGAVGSLGFCSNLLVLLLFWRYRALRSPINLLLLNIALSDLLVCALGTPLGLAAAARGRGSPGAACAWHGFANALCGIVSLISLAVLSYERYCTMTGTTEADTTNYRKTWTGIILSWTYSLVWTAPPLFGWSSYGPEGPGTTCSVNWHSRDANNVSYIICLIFCLLIPFVIIVYSYGKLLCAIRQVSRFLSCLFTATPNQAETSAHHVPPLSSTSQSQAYKLQQHDLLILFYRCFLALLRCNKATANSSNKSLSRSCRALQRVQGNTGPVAAASAGQPSANSLDPAGNPHPPLEEALTSKRAVLVGLQHLTWAAGLMPWAAALFGEFESRRESFAK